MKASYRQLLDEHRSIEQAADTLLLRVEDEQVGAAELAVQLDELARVVEDHVEVEEGVISTLDTDRLTGPWVETWVEGVTSFERLKADWLVFLKTWDRSAIERDRRGFGLAAHAILGRLRERVQAETRAFYATALQTGAIELR